MMNYGKALKVAKRAIRYSGKTKYPKGAARTVALAIVGLEDRWAITDTAEEVMTALAKEPGKYRANG